MGIELGDEVGKAVRALDGEVLGKKGEVVGTSVGVEVGKAVLGDAVVGVSVGE